jgi:site-specific recombinase XerC
MDIYRKKNDNEYAEETKTSWRKTAFLPTDEQKEDRPSGASAPDERTLREKQLDLYLEQLSDEEKSPYTIAKYRRDARQFLDFSEGKEFSRETSKKYKAWLQEKHYRMNSVNSMLADVLGHSSLNTTRIYIKTTGQAHLERIEKLHLAEAE